MPDGSLEPAHAHNWSATTEVSCPELDANGMVMDFCRLKDSLDTIITDLTGVGIEHLEYFKANGQTAEVVARYIFGKLQPELPDRVKLESVEVVEQPGCAAKFTSPNPA